MTYENQIEQLADAMNDVALSSLGNQRCDFTGWSVAECLANIALEFKRMNDLKEQELKK